MNARRERRGDMSGLRASTQPLLGAGVALLFAVLATACSTARGGGETAAKPPPGTMDQVAVLRGIGGSAVFGKIRVIDRGDRAAVLVSMMNVPPGDYRVAFHEVPNCTSPNGFSAGPAWAPAGRKPDDLTPVEHVNSENHVEVEFRVAGLRASGPDGVAGRSVVVHAGRGIGDARAGVPNERIACGVFEPVRPLSF